MIQKTNQEKTLVLCAILFAILWHFEILRVHPDTECRGIDIQKHGEPAYPQVFSQPNGTVALQLKLFSGCIWSWMGL